MKNFLISLIVSMPLFAAEIPAGHYKTDLFSDDFSSAQKAKIWKAYKSESKVQEGILIGLMPNGADHNAVDSVVLPKAVGDVEVAVDFKFMGSPSFTVAFNDRKYKGSHAGHICRVAFNSKSLTFKDGKTGIFKNEIWAKKKAGKLDAATTKLLKTKQQKLNYTFKKGEWYKLIIRIKGNEMQAFINGELAGSFKSQGIAHSSKNHLALVTAKQAMHIDNVKVRIP